MKSAKAIGVISPTDARHGQYSLGHEPGMSLEASVSRRYVLLDDFRARSTPYQRSHDVSVPSSRQRDELTSRPPRRDPQGRAPHRQSRQSPPSGPPPASPACWKRHVLGRHSTLPAAQCGRHVTPPRPQQAILGLAPERKQRKQVKEGTAALQRARDVAATGSRRPHVRGAVASIAAAGAAQGPVKASSCRPGRVSYVRGWAFCTASCQTDRGAQDPAGAGGRLSGWGSTSVRRTCVGFIA